MGKEKSLLNMDKIKDSSLKQRALNANKTDGLTYEDELMLFLRGYLKL
ncbi:MAG: hypothetical protein IBX55_01030 [Methyloprofundus sp.]|nr:hypothetical protein [Methyloprofundus sp.]